MYLGIIFFAVLCLFVFPAAFLSFLKPCDNTENSVKSLHKVKVVLKYYNDQRQCWVCEFYDGALCFGHLFAGVHDYSKGQEVDVVKQELSSGNDGRWILTQV